MCLSTITDKKPPKAGVGWKIFRKHGGRLLSFYRGKQIPLKIGRWLNEKDFRENESFKIRSDMGKEYLTGWHIYTKIPNSTCLIKKVKYRGAHTQGEQNWENIIVAKEMLIMREEG